MNQVIFTAILILAFSFTAFTRSNENLCPKITIVSPDKMLVPFEASIFTVELDEKIELPNLRYDWTTSKGEITKGQGTSKIELFVTPEDYGANVTVNVKVTGLPENCNQTVSETFGVVSYIPLEPLDQYEKVSANEEKARLDNLFFRLSQDETYEGVIILKFDKKTSMHTQIKRIRRIIKFLEFRKYDLKRVTFMLSEYSFDYTSLLALQEDSEFFKDLNKVYKTFKAEEFEQKIKKLFPGK